MGELYTYPEKIQGLRSATLLKGRGRSGLFCFTDIQPWHCGSQERYHGLNDKLAVNRFQLKGCHLGLRQPNRSKDHDMVYPFLVNAPGAEDEISIIQEEATSASFESERAKNLIFNYTSRFLQIQAVPQMGQRFQRTTPS